MPNLYDIVWVRNLEEEDPMVNVVGCVIRMDPDDGSFTVRSCHEGTFDFPELCPKGMIVKRLNRFRLNEPTRFDFDTIQILRDLLQENNDTLLALEDAAEVMTRTGYRLINNRTKPIRAGTELVVAAQAAWTAAGVDPSVAMQPIVYSVIREEAVDG